MKNILIRRNQTNLIDQLTLMLFGMAYTVSIARYSQIYSFFWLNKISTYLIILFLIVGIIRQIKLDFKYKELLIYFVLIVISLYVSIITNENEFFVLVASIISLRKLPFKKIIFVMIIAQVTIISITVILYIINMIPGVITKRRSGEIRYSLGFGHPLFPSQVLYNFWILLLMYYRNNIKFIVIPLMFLSYVPIYLYTDSKTNIILVGVVIILLLHFFLVKRFSKEKAFSLFLKRVAMLSFFVFLFLSIYVAKNYKPIGIYLSMNEIFTGRLELWNVYFQNYHFTMFGQKIYEYSFLNANDIGLGLKSLVLDNGYLKFLYKFGIFTFGIFSVYSYFLIKWCNQNKEIVILISFVAMMLYGFVSGAFYDFTRNPLLFLILLMFHSNETSQLKVDYYSNIK